MILFFAVAALVIPEPLTKTFDATTFTVPSGFEYWESPDHVNFRRIDPANWLLFGIYKARPAGSDLTADFNTDWNDLLRASGVAAPTATSRRVGPDLAALTGAAMTPEGYVELIDVEAGGSIVSVIVESGSAEGFEIYQNHRGRTRQPRRDARFACGSSGRRPGARVS